MSWLFVTQRSWTPSFSCPHTPLGIDHLADPKWSRGPALSRSEDAEATAVDRSPRLLDHLRGKARARGVEDRVRTVQADLDAAWPDLGTVDLVWASASLHHLTDPERGLREIFESLRPGGLLAVVEMAGFVRSRIAGELSPDDLATLDHLLDSGGPDGVVRRDDLTVRTERTLWAARRP
ncbi:class I SAM-dependent methyltransferase [Stenotrophomonas sp. NPDC087984]